MSIATTPRESLIEPRGHGSNGHNGRHTGGRRRRSLLPVALLLALVAVASVGVYLLLRGGSASGVASGMTFEVAQGPIVVSVTESGTIKAAQQEILRAEVEGRTTIIHLVPEGSLVKKGDLLVELDSSGMEDEKLEDTISVQNAEAAWIRAREDLEVAKNQALADVAQAKLDYRFAQEDLRKYQEGEYPNLHTEAKSKIEIAREEFERAKSQYEGSLRLFEEKFISETEKEADRLAMEKARLNLQLAEQALDLLEQWEYKRQIDQLTSDVEQKRMALERAERKASADVVQAEAELKARESELQRHRDRLERVIGQLAKAKIYAPRDGLVVYATSVEGGGFRGNQEPLDEGQEVRERQELIYLPTATEMIAEIKVHESSLEKVRLGMPVRITVDALPGKSYWGEVTKIAPLPDAQSMWMNPDLKVYNTQIRIAGNGPELRTGMSCRAEIIVENYDNAIYVPVQSIVRVSGVPTAFVVKPGDTSPEQREVEIGQDNNRMVVIRSGLEPGEKVLLAPPLGDTGTVETLRPEELPEEQKQMAEDAQDNPGGRPADMSGAGMGQPGMEQGMGGAGEGMQRGAGGNNGGAPDPAAMERMRRAQEELQSKMTDEEKARFTELQQAGDMRGMMEYGQEMARKYGVEMPAMGQRRAGGQGREGGRDRSGGRGGAGERPQRDGDSGEPEPAGEPSTDDAGEAPAKAPAEQPAKDAA